MHVITDGSGAVTERYAYGAFGEPLVYDGTGQALTGSAVDNSYLFAGREWDGESRLCHLRHRDVPRRGECITCSPGSAKRHPGSPVSQPTAFPERET